MALLVQRFYASLEQHIILGGRASASRHQGVWAGCDTHTLLYGCCGSLFTWLGSASHSKLRVISSRRAGSACLDLRVAKSESVLHSSDRVCNLCSIFYHLIAKYFMKLDLFFAFSFNLLSWSFCAQIIHITPKEKKMSTFLVNNFLSFG